LVIDPQQHRSRIEKTERASIDDYRLVLLRAVDGKAAEVQLSEDTVFSMGVCNDSGRPPHLERLPEKPPVKFVAEGKIV